MYDETNETLEQLELLIGKENTRKVYEFFAGESIYFPKRIGLAELQTRIYADLRGGMGYGEAARKYGYSKAYIRKIEHRAMEKERAERAAGKAAGTPRPPEQEELGFERPS
jgi:Mor family transcriptional regulator